MRVCADFVEMTYNFSIRRDTSALAGAGLRSTEDTSTLSLCESSGTALENSRYINMYKFINDPRVIGDDMLTCLSIPSAFTNSDNSFLSSLPPIRRCRACVR